MFFEGKNLHVPTYGLVVNFPAPFATVPKLTVTANDPARRADYSNEGVGQFNLFIFDINGKSVGGKASYRASDE